VINVFILPPRYFILEENLLRMDERDYPQAVTIELFTPTFTVVTL